MDKIGGSVQRVYQPAIVFRSQAARTFFGNVNFIVPGNQYRLEYWDNSSWKFFGEQIATDFSLNFSNVPTGRLYILHNLTNGVEERIFTYEDGKQVWW